MLNERSYPPDWFQLSLYSTDETNPLDFQGWEEQISSRNTLQLYLAAGKTDEFDVTFEQLKGSPFYSFDGLVTNAPSTAASPLTWWKVASIYELLHDSLDVNNGAERKKSVDEALSQDSGYKEAFSTQLNVTIDLTASKKEILQSLTALLVAAKEKFNATHAGSTSSISASVLASWSDFQMLPYQDLLLWHQRNEIKLPSDTILADWLFPKGDGDKDKVRRTRHLAQSAFTLATIRHLSIAAELAEYLPSVAANF